MKRLRWKLILILTVVALSAWGIWPIQRKIRLGLDLKGGMHLVLQVHMDDALRAQRDHDLNGIRAWLQDKGWLAWFRFDTPAVDRIEIRPASPRTLSRSNGPFRNWVISSSGTIRPITLRSGRMPSRSRCGRS